MFIQHFAERIIIKHRYIHLHPTIVITAIKRSQSVKIGNVPDAAVRRGMELWGQHVAPAVRDL